MKTIEQIFDRASKSYDKTEEGRFKAYTEKTLEMTGKYLGPEHIVLDCGCATGTKALALVPKVNRICGIDISSKMIDLAQKKAAEADVRNVEFTRASIFDERFSEGSMDILLIFNILHLLEDPRAVILKAVDLLKHGGLLISTTPCLSEKMSFSYTLQFFLMKPFMRLRFFFSIKLFTYLQMEDLAAHERLQTVEAKTHFYGLSSYFIVARKTE